MKYHHELKREIVEAMSKHSGKMRKTLPTEVIIPDVVGEWIFQPVKRGSKQLSQEYFPLLTKIAMAFPDVIHCSVSRVGPRARIPVHTGYSRGLFRLLYPVKVPRDGHVHLTAFAERHTFKEGVPCIFDDNFEHAVVNDTDEDRIVIYMDIVRPFSNKLLDQWNRFLLDKANDFVDAANSRNEKAEGIA